MNMTCMDNTQGILLLKRYHVTTHMSRDRNVANRLLNFDLGNIPVVKLYVFLRLETGT